MARMSYIVAAVNCPKHLKQLEINQGTFLFFLLLRLYRKKGKHSLQPQLLESFIASLSV